jgi:hypothetical protein
MYWLLILPAELEQEVRRAAIDSFKEEKKNDVEHGIYVEAVSQAGYLRELNFLRISCEVIKEEQRSINLLGLAGTVRAVVFECRRPSAHSSLVRKEMP